MSRENVEVVRRYLELIRRGDLSAALTCLDPEVEYEVSQELPMRGHDAVRDWRRVRLPGESPSRKQAGAMPAQGLSFFLECMRDSIHQKRAGVQA